MGRWGKWQEAEKVGKRGRVRRRQIVNPAEEGRMPHLDRHKQHFVEREEHRDLNHDRQAAGQWIGADTLVERHHLLLLAGLVVRKALAQFLDLRLQELHLAHCVVRFVGEREEEQLYAQREQQGRQAKITENPVKNLARQKDWFGQEVEPAEIDRVVK